MSGEADYQPVAAQERILLIDLLRGLAMFGVLWSNLNDWYGADVPHNALESGFRWVQDWIVESRFYSLLGFLFGYGFGIQLLRADERGVDVRVMFYRRMGALLLIGVAHGLFLWRGDILTAYAITGAVLALFRRTSSRGLLIAAILMLVVVPFLEFVAVYAFHIHLPNAPNQDRIDWVYSHGSIVQIAAMGREGYFYWYTRWAPFVLPSFLSLFLLGLYAAKGSLLQRLAGCRQELVRICATAAVGTLLAFGLIALLERLWPEPGSQQALGNPIRRSVFWVVGHFPTWSGAATLAAGLAVLATFPRIATRLTPLAAVGRMSLTTYLAQTVVSITLFYHFGFGLYGRVAYPGLFVITVVVFALQMAVSAWWLERFRFGPVEWVWRSMAYMRRQPMRQRNARSTSSGVP